MIRSIILLLAFAISLSATTINVPADQATIQAGIDAAVDGDTVLVEAGLYYETIDFIGKNIALVSSSGPSATIIDGTGGDTTIVVNMSSWGFSADCKIDGFTIQNGLNGIAASADHSNPTLTVRSCIITNTTTAISGHFMQSWEISNTLIINNENGFAKGYYGDNSVITNCTFDNLIRDIEFNPSYGTTSELSIYNSIFRNQIDGHATNPVNMYYCDYSDGALGTNVNIITGNINSDPLFVDIANDDYLLQATSPCIDAGDPISLSNDFDGSRNDIGYTGGNSVIVEKSIINFGFVSDGSSSEATVRLTNYSDEIISLNDYSNNDAQFNIYTTFPVTLSPGESTEISFSYTAVSAGLSSDIITVNVTGIQGVSTADFIVSGYTIVYDGGTINVPGAAPTIQSAIDFASHGDTVLVQPGTYVENINFNGKNIVLGSLFLTTQDTSFISSTKIDGNQIPHVVTFNNNESGIATLSGFTIFNGMGSSSYHGGGILITNSSPDINNCIIRDNQITWYGGGISIQGNCSPILDGLIIKNNIATHHGGGIAILGGATPIIQNTLLFGNSTGELGGAIFIADGATKASLINCTLTKNTATGYNNVFGGGISISGQADLDILNSIVWDNVPNQIDDEYDVDQSVNFSCVQNGHAGIGNITNAPQFVDPISDDYNLQAGSPCIDSGDPTSPRDDDGSRADMGAFPSTFGQPLALVINIPGEFESIQAGVDAARDGDTILVQPGTFVENIIIDGKDITIGSLFLTTQDSSYISQTIIDGNQSGSVLQVLNSGLGSVSLVGLSIQNGSGTNEETYIPWVGGGGIFTKDANVDINSCRIANCSETYRYGGGILFYPTSKILTISNSVIENCVSSDGGGGISFSGGALFVDNTKIKGCSAGYTGGGIYGEGTHTITNSTFENNVSGSIGGAIGLQGGNTLIKSTLIIDNIAGNGGGGIRSSWSSNITLDNVTMSGNNGTTRGGAVFIDHNGNLTVQNSVLFDNNDDFASEIYVEATNTTTELIVEYSNLSLGDSTIFFEDGTVFTLSHTNLSVNPNFVNSNEKNYLLVASSQCINAGHPDSTDSDGSRADMGAYPYLNEYSGPDWHVSVDGDDISGTGEMSSPFASIQAGINFASEGDSVLVAQGTYNENLTFRGRAITVRGSEGAQNSIIDGSGLGSVIMFNNAETNTTKLTGFTITNGHAYTGGGIYLSGASPILEDLYITENIVDYQGGGIYAEGSNSTINNCTISNNQCPNLGGGILAFVSRMEIINTKISQNSASYGGGICVAQNPSPTLTNVIIANNTATSYGGGIYLGANATPSILNSSIVNNTSILGGGGFGIDGSHPTILNSILYHNTPQEVFFDTDYGNQSSLSLSHCNIEGGFGGIVTNDMGTIEWLSGNIESTPQFVNNDSSNYMLSDYSPCLGTGLDSLIVPVLDFAGNPRPNPAGSNPDIGAYESPLSEPVVILGIQNLDIGGEEGIQHLLTHTPDVSFTYYNSLEEPLSHYQIQMSSLADFSAINMWDTYTVIGSDTVVTYAGNALTDGEQYYLRVKGTSGDFWSDWATISFRMNSIPQPPTLVSPIENSVVGDEGLFTLQNSTDTELDDLMYQFKLYEDMAMTTLVDSSEFIPEGLDVTTWASASELSDNSQYWWTSRVFDGFEYSAANDPASFLVNTENAPPESFELIFPLVDMELSTLTPSFSWHTALDVDPEDVVSYSLHLDTPEPGVQVYELGLDTLFLPPSPLMDNTTYFWRVVAEDILGMETENTNGYQSFTVNTSNDLPIQFDLLYPVRDDMVTNLRPEFLWEASSDPDDGTVALRESGKGKFTSTTSTGNKSVAVITGYDFYISTDSILTDAVSVEVLGTSYSPAEDMLENQTYYWAVSALDDDGGVTFSDTASFWTNADNEAPAEFALLLPTDAEVLTVLSPTFTWESSSDPDLYDGLGYHILLGSSPEDMDTLWSGEDTTLTLDWELEDNRTYYWSVFAEDWNGLTTFNVEGYQSFTINQGNDSPSMVELITPDSVMILTLTPEMYWTAAVDADPGDIVSYEMHWWADGIEFDSVLTDTNAAFVTGELEDNTQYFWEVIAMDQSDGISHSEEATFWTDLVAEAPSAFALLSPEDDVAGLSDMPSFGWEPSDDPDPMDFATYTIQVATDSNFVDVVFDANTELEVAHDMTEALLADTEYWWRVVATDTDSLTTESETFKFTVGYVSISEAIALPTEYVLDQNYPNPFNPSTTLRYGLPEASNVSLIIYDLRGNVVQTLESGTKAAGWYDLVWNGQTNDGRSISTGLYFARIVAGEYSQVIKMLYLK